MNKITIITEGAPKPLGAYSQGIKAENLVFVSGQIAVEPETGEFLGGNIKEQTERVLKNVEAVLLAGNSSLDMAVKMTVYLSDIADFPTVNEVFNKVFPEQPPAREAIQVAGLPGGAKIEVSAIGLAKT